MQSQRILHVPLGHLTGFATDLENFTERFWETARTHGTELDLPATTSGLLADLCTPVQGFRSTVEEAHCRTRDRLAMLSEGLSDTGRAFRESEHVYDTSEIVRFAGAQHPEHSDVPPATNGTRQVVQWAIETLSPFADGLRNSGIPLIDDHLPKLDCDWGQLQPLAARITQLGINDRALGSNVDRGSQWLTGSWLGHTAESFQHAASSFTDHTTERGVHMEQVAAAVAEGGRTIEQQIRNQAQTLVADLLHPTDHLGFSLPLALYGTIVNEPMPADMHSAIQADLRTVTEAARSRHDAIVTTLHGIQTALASPPGWTSPGFEPVSPAPNTACGVNTYGFGHHREWEISLEASTL